MNLRHTHTHSLQFAIKLWHKPPLVPDFLPLVFNQEKEKEVFYLRIRSLYIYVIMIGDR